MNYINWLKEFADIIIQETMGFVMTVTAIIMAIVFALTFRLDEAKISFSYVPGEKIIDDFSLTVKKGQKIAIVGGTGAGKTTLVKLFMKFYPIDSGEIKIDGVNIANNKYFHEKDYYAPSEEGFNVFDTEFGKIGIVVCYDRHYPKSIYLEAMKGAKLILVPTANTLQEDTELFKWEIKVQAWQNKVNIAMCNRVGKEDKMEFSGESIICDLNGKTISLGGHKEEIVYGEVNLD